jgi:hypothetical protein
LTCAGVRVSRLPESPSLLRAPPLSSRRPAQSADMLCNTALLDLHALRRLYAGRVSIHLYVCVCERESVCVIFTMRFAVFIILHAIVIMCQLTEAEVFALRFYTTAGFKGINWQEFLKIICSGFYLPNILGH